MKRNPDSLINNSTLKKIYSKKIELELYTSNIRVVISKNIIDTIKFDDNLKYIKEEDVRDSDGYITNICEDDDTYVSTYCLLKLDIDDGVLVHEAFHLACKIQERIGSYLHEASEENYAYLIEYIYKKLKKIHQKAQKKIQYILDGSKLR